MSEFKPINPEALQDNPFSLIGKGWMLITAGRDKCNAMTASWGGLGVMWSKNVAFVVVRPQRYTYQFTEQQDTFSLCFFDPCYRDALTLCGTKSGRDIDKPRACGLDPIFDTAPYFEQAQLVVLCRKLYYTDMGDGVFVDKSVEAANYPEKDYHRLYIGEIEKVYRHL